MTNKSFFFNLNTGYFPLANISFSSFADLTQGTLLDFWNRWEEFPFSNAATKEGRQGFRTAKLFSNCNQVVLMPEKSCYRIKQKDQPVRGSAGDTRPIRVLFNLDPAIWGGFCWTVPSEFCWNLDSSCRATQKCMVLVQKKKTPKFLQMLRLNLFLFSWQHTRMPSHPWGVHALCWDILTLRLRAIMPVEAVPPERRSSPGSGPPRSQQPSALTSASAPHPAGERRRWRETGRSSATEQKITDRHASNATTSLITWAQKQSKTSERTLTFVLVYIFDVKRSRLRLNHLWVCTPAFRQPAAAS